MQKLLRMHKRNVNSSCGMLLIRWEWTFGLSLYYVTLLVTGACKEKQVTE